MSHNLEKLHDLIIIKHVQRGSFGTVYRAKNTKTQLDVALKVVVHTGNDSRKRGPSPENEYKIQSTLHHENIVELIEHWIVGDSYYLVFEWMECTLANVLEDSQVLLNDAVKKAYMLMLLRATAFLHGKGIMHRDIKPQNLLVSVDGILKLGDFGLARLLPCSDLSSTAGTREYRAPEMLYGSRNYDCKVDLWACGCVCAEIWTGNILFQADSDIGQLGLIIHILGDPEAAGWTDVRSLPDFGKITFVVPNKAQGLRAALPKTSDCFLNCLLRFLVYDPKMRISCEDAIECEFFTCDLFPVDEKELPRLIPAVMPAR